MKNLYIFLLLLAGVFGFGQKIAPTTPFCHSDEVLQNLKNSDPSLQERMNRMDEDIRNFGINFNASSANRPAQTSFTIPVVVYVVHSNQPLGTGSNITDAQVQAQIAALNTYFSGSGLNFCFATKAGSQTLLQAGVNNTTATSTTPGIVHVDDAAIAIHQTTASSQQALVDGTSGNSTLNKNSFLRIWVVEGINGSTNSGIQGYSNFPNTSVNLDGIVMNYRVFGNIANPTCSCSLTANYQQGKILPHEVGHYLGLKHTFEGGCHDTSGINSQIKGDNVVDTPPVNKQNEGCPTNVDSCNEGASNQPDDVSNYMDYTYDACKNHFTTGQQERMLFHLLNYRSGLYDVDNLIFTGVCGSQNLVSANFTGSLDNTSNYIYNICAGSTLFFKPITPSTEYPAGSVLTYLWDFGGGVTSILENSSYLFSSGSNTFFKVSLTVTFNGNSYTSTKNIFVNSCSTIVNSESTLYFSAKNILKFNTGVPRVTGTIDFPGLGIFQDFNFDDGTFYSVALQNNAAGEVLFFCDGKDVFNGLNPANKINSTKLIGGGNHPQDILILKSPVAINEFYILTKLNAVNTITFPASHAGFRYSIVNTINSTVTTGNINNPIAPNVTQTGYNQSPLDGAFKGYSSIQALEKNDGGYWIFSEVDMADGKSYLGVFELSTIGVINLKNTFLLDSNYWWQTSQGFSWFDFLSISPNGDKIFYRVGGQCLILDFDKFSGVLSQTTIIKPEYLFDAIFSNDSKLIYGSIYGQMDIDTPTVQKNPFSKNLNGTRFIYGTDNKIYYSNDIDGQLGVIHKPNAKVTTINPNAFCDQQDFISKDFISDGMLGFNLPNFVQAKKTTAYTVNQISAYKVDCGSYKFFPDVPTNTATPVFSWNFGDPNSGATNNTSSLNTPTHVFSGSGTYTVSLTYNGSTTITTQVTITTFTAPAIQGISSVCFNGGNATTFNSVALQEGQTVVWSTTSVTGTIVTNNQSEVQINWTQLPGTVRAVITDASGCVGTVTKTIALNPNIVPTFNVFPISICNGNSVPVLPSTSNNGITGVWSPSVVNNATSGSYTFTPNTNNCASPVTVPITVLPANDPLCGNTNNNCALSTLTLSVPETNTTVLYRRQNSIITNTNYLVTTGKNVTIRAGNSISLKPNTYINSGAVFSAKVEPCVVNKIINIGLDKSKLVVSKNIFLFPNPNNGIFELMNIDATLFGNHTIQLNVYDLNGRNLFSKNLSESEIPNCQVSLQQFMDGMYIVRLNSESYSQDFKLIKK